MELLTEGWFVLVLSVLLGVILSRSIQVVSEWLLGRYFRRLSKTRVGLNGELDSGRSIESYKFDIKWLFLWSYDTRGKLLVLLSDVLMVAGVYYVFGEFVSGTVGSFVGSLVLVVVLGLSYGTDVRERYILNLYTYPGIVMIGLCNIFYGEYVWWFYVGGALLVSGMLFLAMLLTRKQMGLGDVKLYAMIGMYVGLFDIVYVILISSVLGLIYGLYAMKRAGKSEYYAFGPFIVMGVLIVLLFDLGMKI